MINVYWNNPEESIIRLDYADPVASWDEYDNAVKQWHNMIRSKSGVVHTIHNPGSAKMPSGNAFMHVRRAMNNTPRNSGLIVMVISDFFAKSVIDILLRMAFSANFRMVNSLEEAETLINSCIPSVPPTSTKRSTITGVFSRESLGL
jgi:hypothetical protein